ncbi:hypothetical protein EJ04DRAFT_517763 [Polyplosphaeria fusca]|uniref:Uncharacterized protein n=1 Tax=Polyplosphaeria fusca TaxID=682080 RepID=A0A9P4UV63_9PLEO|nr:hypothetical protein EJ04DRAFT_517763 [Polyplosphaeria fusca]
MAAESQGPPDEGRLKEAAAQAQKAIDAQSTAMSLRNAAASITDPKKREKMLTDAYNKEIEAHGNSKKARMLSSGAFQGAMGGGGIGGVVGMGVGTVVGTVVGGLTAIPTTGLGLLVGSGVGAIHGPFIKLTGIGKSEDDKEKGDKGEEKEINPEDDDVVPNPEVLRRAADALAEEKAKQEKGDQAQPGERKKPRKIEVRSKPPAEGTG